MCGRRLRPTASEAFVTTSSVTSGSARTAFAPSSRRSRLSPRPPTGRGVTLVARPGPDRDRAPDGDPATRCRCVHRLRPQDPLAGRVPGARPGNRATGPRVSVSRGRRRWAHAVERPSTPREGAVARRAAGAADVRRRSRRRSRRGRGATRRPRRARHSLRGHGPSVGGDGAQLPVGLGLRRRSGGPHGLRAWRAGFPGARHSSPLRGATARRFAATPTSRPYEPVEALSTGSLWRAERRSTRGSSYRTPTPSRPF